MGLFGKKNDELAISAAEKEKFKNIIAEVAENSKRLSESINKVNVFLGDMSKDTQDVSAVMSEVGASLHTMSDNVVDIAKVRGFQHVTHAANYSTACCPPFFCSFSSKNFLCAFTVDFFQRYK